MIQMIPQAKVKNNIPINRLINKNRKNHLKSKKTKDQLRDKNRRKSPVRKTSIKNLLLMMMIIFIVDDVKLIHIIYNGN
jgi:hypothetical protein